MSHLQQGLWLGKVQWHTCCMTAARRSLFAQTCIWAEGWVVLFGIVWDGKGSHDCESTFYKNSKMKSTAGFKSTGFTGTFLLSLPNDNTPCKNTGQHFVYGENIVSSRKVEESSCQIFAFDQNGSLESSRTVVKKHHINLCKVLWSHHVLFWCSWEIYWMY